jgi:hypothetical protein
MNDITTAMSELLKALGFEAMAKEVIGETDGERLRRYARVIIRNSPQANKARLLALFHSQNIYPVLK